MTQKKLRRIKTRISPDILDTIGRSFKFKHGKGIAEWLKNSLDQYLRLVELSEESLPGGWPVIVDIIDGKGQSKGPNIGVIDFGGTTFKRIEEFFLYWGDRSAATHGGSINTAAVTGGHGNGGKFYMREMWRDGARFLTWKKGRCTSLVVKKMDDKSTGYFEIEDATIGWREALEVALSVDEHLGGAEHIIDYLGAKYSNILLELDNQQRGLSVVVGKRAVQSNSANDVVTGGKWKHQQLIDEIRDAQQARRPLRELSISVIVNGQLQLDKLTRQSIEEDPQWIVEESAVSVAGDEGSALTEMGVLRIYNSANQLTGRLKDLNALFISDGNGNPIAFYPIHELPLPGYSSLLNFIYAELQLEFPGLSELITNDRERLVDSDNTRNIVEWVGSKIWARIQAIEKSIQENKHKQNLETASKMNDSLNKHAQRFLKQVQSEIMVDYVSDSQGGGPGSGGTGTGGTGETSGDGSQRTKGKGGTEGTGGSLETSGNSKRVRRAEFPKMLLSGYDPDPAKENGDTKHLTDRYPPLSQDDIDRVHNIWWLNTTHPYADKTLKRGGPDGAAFKSHHLSMFRDMVQREALRILQRREAELPLDRIENELDEISNRFLAELPWELVQDLLD